jgi:hypothetical protein
LKLEGKTLRQKPERLLKWRSLRRTTGVGDMATVEFAHGTLFVAYRAVFAMKLVRPGCAGGKIRIDLDSRGIFSHATVCLVRSRNNREGEEW